MTTCEFAAAAVSLQVFLGQGDSHLIRKVSFNASGAFITTVAGTGTAGFADGDALTQVCGTGRWCATCPLTAALLTHPALTGSWGLHHSASLPSN